jgi:hypothetical protein
MKTRSLAKPKKSALKKKKKPDNVCKFAFSDSRNCAMPRWKQHKKYCLFHAHQEQQLIDAGELGDELAAFSGEFRTNTDLNRALGNLFQAVAQNRIPPRSAAVLAYIGQLLQHNISNLQDEIVRVDGEEGLDHVVRSALDAHDGGTDRVDQKEADDAAQAAADDAKAAEEAAQNALLSSAPIDNESDDLSPRSSRRHWPGCEKFYPHIVGFDFHPNHTGGIYVPIVEKPKPPIEPSSSSTAGASRQW